jgi:hypothetical protein
MTASGEAETVSERVRVALGASDPLVTEVAALERMNSARSVAITTNGKFPFWSFERWVSVLTFVSVIVGGIWFAAVKWTGIEQDMAAVKRDVSETKTAVKGLDLQQQDLRLEMLSIKRADEYFRTTPATGPVTR